MKFTTNGLLLGLVLVFTLTSTLEAQTINDGPYVSYERDSIVFRSVANGKNVFSALPASRKNRTSFTVAFPSHNDWNFTVPLKKELHTEQSEFPQPKKIFFISDIEGEFDGFRKLLIANKVIDINYKWTFGKGHLVVCGDLFDRGQQVPEVIWLLYKLEDLAASAGGYVHVILGNHDIMNLSGDLRYLHKKYVESAKIMEVDYMSLYDEHTELGRWLRTKNTIEKIGDNLCMHAGVAPIINTLGLSVTEINTRCRPFYDKAKILKGVGDPKIDPFFMGATSLFWYRGYFAEPKATEAEVEATLQTFSVARMVVGHTIVPGNVNFYYGRKVLGLDVNQHAGDTQAALFENEKWYKLDQSGNKTAF